MNNNKKLKEKLINHIYSNGKKKTSEKVLTKSLKSIQKSQKKSHNEIIKLAIINSTPTFRTITLKNKKTRKKTIKEIPTFLSAYIFRTSWALKYIAKTSKTTAKNNYSSNLKKEIVSNANQQGIAVKTKNELQNQTLKKKNFFRKYRW